MKRIMFFIYGAICYSIFFGTYLYAIGFLGNLVVPKSIDSAAGGPLGMALLINTGILGLFAIQHSVMARPGFKKKWTKIIPKPIERSTYTLLASLILLLLFWQWRPIGGTIWSVEAPVLKSILYAVFGLGWIIVLISTFQINHFDLFGLRQVWLYLRNKEYTPLKFQVPFFYKYVRHPLYVGWFLAFWATPTMTAAHLFFAIIATAYILVAIKFEEKDLINEHGANYVNYKKRVPMLIPFFRKNKKAEPVLGEAK